MKSNKTKLKEATEQADLLFDLVDAGYSKAVAKVMTGEELDPQDKEMLELFKNQTKRLVQILK